MLGPLAGGLERRGDVAQRALRLGGYAAASLNAILARSGATRGSLYHHFESKQALFEVVLNRVVSEVAAAGVEAACAQSDPVESLRAGAASWLRETADPAVQRIVPLDAPAVVGWSRWRGLDEQYALGDVRHSLQPARRTRAAAGRQPSASRSDRTAARSRLEAPELTCPPSRQRSLELLLVTP